MIRKARIEDIPQIQALINTFAKKDLMLPRSLNELYERIRDFSVYSDKGKVVGCCALHVSWQDLAEVQSLAVTKAYQKKGMGAQLLVACLREAKGLGAKKVFTLTYIPAFFTKFGFRKVAHADLPKKIWAECINCPEFPDCQEIALLKIL